MKGTTHLAIGGAIGAAACLYYPFSLEHSALYLSIACFSALSADLDGPSLLSGKLGKLSRILRNLALWTGIGFIAAFAYLYFSSDKTYPIFSTIAVAMFILGLITKEGTIRNALVSLVGIALLYFGWTSTQQWLMGFGLFVAWVPWLKHRGMTHTLWALVIWGTIGRGLEQQLGITGITAVAVAGYASHLIADTLTPSGVKWLYPLYKKSIKIH
ncbi:metal-dependent hydrolase [Cohnella cholangitidis]|uniref:Metal-dependent hydrolase n=1 Tax=Cohnella cholangitidis TaxID=2598458 RepID=A0A7G5BSM4_9BACL|nr:metal-dependent hydrolase [Cohnella cholangitidis]QMV39958.1 metal-dependent hydrolase [Cohnella cholangitidis]